MRSSDADTGKKVMIALRNSATFGLLAVPSTAADPACDNSHDHRPATTLKDAHYEQQDRICRHASRTAPRRASVRCAALILIVAVLLIAESVASTCAYHRPANTIAVHINDEEGDTP